MKAIDIWLTKAAQEVSKSRPQAAIRLCQKVLSRQPNEPRALHLLGAIKVQDGQVDYGIDLLRRAEARSPASAEIQNSLGIAYKKKGWFDAAIGAYSKAIEIQPGLAGAHVNLANLLKIKHCYDEAVASYEHAIKLHPRFALAHFHLGHTLATMGRIHDAADSYRRAIHIAPNLERAHSSLLFILHCLPDVEASFLASAHREWGRAYLRQIAATIPTSVNNVPDKRLHLGYLSRDFHTHSVAYFLESILERHKFSQWRVTCYHAADRTDHTTLRLKAAATDWRDISGLTDLQAAERIRMDGVDILVDLGGHTNQSRLRVLAHRAAPVQITYLGYPNTTGLPTVDYRITDALADPPGYEVHYTEKLVRLDGGFLCYRPPPTAPQVVPPPVMHNGYITFGSFNHIMKMNEDVVALWARVLQRVSGSRLTVKAEAFASESVRKHFSDLFSHHNIAADRLNFLSRIEALEDHLAAYSEIDIALDPFPYNGTTTTCEAMWMGVPVVSLVGHTHAGRVGISLLSRVGLSEFATFNPEHYADTAVGLAHDRDKLHRLRIGMRARVASSPLCDAESFTSRLEETYRKLWIANSTIT